MKIKNLLTLPFVFKPDRIVVKIALIVFREAQVQLVIFGDLVDDTESISEHCRVHMFALNFKTAMRHILHI
jgi:hypothetical protein